MDFKTFISGVGNDLKTSIDDVIGTIVTIQDDVAKLKTKTSKPDKDTAKALLEYIAMEDSKTKENMEALCSKEIQQYLNWIDDYCSEHNCTQEEALQRIIDGN